MHTRLRNAGVPISEREVSNLLDRYDELVAVKMLDPARVQQLTADQQQVILALDGRTLLGSSPSRRKRSAPRT